MNSDPDPATDSGKTRAQRIRLDYYKKRGQHDIWRWRLAMFAVLFVGGYCAWAFLAPTGMSQFSTGKISAAHAGFENDCQACHVDYSPLAKDAWSYDSKHAAESIAATCRNCHSVASHYHDRLSESGAMIDNKCTTCHREHLGRDYALVSNDKAGCVTCHADLDPFRVDPGANPVQANIANFSLAGHSDFASINSKTAVDRGNIKFNHALHLMPGQVREGYRGGMTLDRIPDTLRENYKATDDKNAESLVQLDCENCHTFGSSNSEQFSDLASGLYANPISYAQHCSACHQLSILGQSEDEPPVPHAVAPERLRNTIFRRLVSFEGNEKLAGGQPRKANKILFPGQDTQTLRGDSNASSASMQFRAEQLIKQIENQCLYCHNEGVLDGDPGSAHVPNRWMVGGSYNHQSHAGVSCLFCHPQTDPQMRTVDDDQRNSLQTWLTQINQAATEVQEPSDPDDQRIMILGIVSCVPCHDDTRPRESGVLEKPSEFASLFGNVPTTAPSTCTTCHKYHLSIERSDQPEEN